MIASSAHLSKHTRTRTTCRMSMSGHLIAHSSERPPNRYLLDMAVIAAPTPSNPTFLGPESSNNCSAMIFWAGHLSLSTAVATSAYWMRRSPSRARGPTVTRGPL